MTNTPRPADDLGFTNLWRFLGFVRPYWQWMAGGVITGLVRLGLPLFMPVFLANVVDYVASPFLGEEITRPNATERLMAMLAVFGALAVVHSGATLGRFYFPQMAVASAMRDVRYTLYGHLQRLSLGFHHQRPTGAIVSRVINDVETAQGIIETICIVASQNLVRCVVVVGIMLWLDWQWALVAMATLPFFYTVVRILRRRMRKASRRVQESIAQIAGRVQERLAMIREVQAFTAEDVEEEAVRIDAERLRNRTVRQRLLNGILHSATELTRFSALALVISFGVYRIITTRGQPDAVTAGMLFLYFQYTNMAMQPMVFFSELYAKLHLAAAAADRVFDFFDTDPDQTNAPGARPLNAPRPPAVEFDNVSFSYPVQNPQVVLRGITFQGEPGARVVLVGESGSGKSTLMSLLPRFYDVHEGDIRIAGQSTRNVTIRSLRDAIGVVPQEPVMFSGTIRENICYGRPDAKERDIRAAAQAANAETFILEQPDGYDTVIGERGVGLSGGQIQRLAIARAFLKDPAILIFDEATSNLDATSEALVLEAMNRLSEGRTTFMIAHRLSTARDADLIIVLDAGRIVEQGTHDQLIDANGAYAGLWNKQMQGVG